MSNKLHRDVYEKLIAEDVVWLMKQPRSLERDHIALILQRSADLEYAGETAGGCPCASCFDRRARSEGGGDGR